MSRIKNSARLLNLFSVAVDAKTGDKTFAFADLDNFKTETGVSRAFKQEDARFDALTNPAEYKKRRREMLEKGVKIAHTLYTGIFQTLLEYGDFPSEEASDMGLAVARATLEAYKMAINEIFPEDPTNVVSELSIAKEARREAIRTAPTTSLPKLSGTPPLAAITG
jgi:hypothetical protein